MKRSTPTAWRGRVGRSLRAAAALKCGTSPLYAKKRPITGSIWPRCLWEHSARHRMPGVGELRRPGSVGEFLRDLCELCGYNLRTLIRTKSAQDACCSSMKITDAK